MSFNKASNKTTRPVVASKTNKKVRINNYKIHSPKIPWELQEQRREEPMSLEIWAVTSSKSAEGKLFWMIQVQRIFCWPTVAVDSGSNVQMHGFIKLGVQVLVNFQFGQSAWAGNTLAWVTCSAIKSTEISVKLGSFKLFWMKRSEWKCRVRPSVFPKNVQ